MNMKLLKRCTAAFLAVSVLSMGLTANAAQSSDPISADSSSTPVLQAYSDSELGFPAPTNGQVPYDQYLSALLDVCFRNDSQAFVALGLGTAEEAASIYNAVLNSELLSIELDSLFTTECPEVLINDLQNLMARMLGSVRYAVTGCELQADGTYQVTIVYEQMILFQPLMELYMAVVTDMATNWSSNYNSYPSDEELPVYIIAALCDSLRVCLDNVTYAEPAITTVSFEPQDGTYLPNMDDLYNLQNLLFDTSYILN